MSTLSSMSTPPPPAAVPPGSFAAWCVAVRPPSLLIAVSPILVGAALAWQQTGALSLSLTTLILITAVLLQVITNLQNDVGYTLRGGERLGTRIGLPRATGAGLLTVGQVRMAIVFAIAAAIAFGMPLVLLRGWTVLAMGAASILAALAYMGGPRPIAYTPLGEAVVFIFFGLVAVLGSFFVLTGLAPSLPVWLAACAVGAIAVAAIIVNNHRDAAHDAHAGRRTFPVVFGTRASGLLYAATLLGPFALALAMAWALGAAVLLPLLLLPLAWKLNRDFQHCAPGLPYNAVLMRTFRMEMAFATLLAVGVVLARLAG